MLCLFVSSVGQVRSSLPRNKFEEMRPHSECPRIEVFKGGSLLCGQHGVPISGAEGS